MKTILATMVVFLINLQFKPNLLMLVLTLHTTKISTHLIISMKVISKIYIKILNLTMIITNISILVVISILIILSFMKICRLKNGIELSLKKMLLMMNVRRVVVLWKIKIYMVNTLIKVVIIDLILTKKT